MNSDFVSSAAFCYGIAFVAVFLATAGQILLKQSADDTLGKKGFLRKFLNWRVVISYGLLFLSMFCNQIALRPGAHDGAALYHCHQLHLGVPVRFLILRECGHRRKLPALATFSGIAISRL